MKLLLLSYHVFTKNYTIIIYKINIAGFVYLYNVIHKLVAFIITMTSFCSK